MFAIYKRELKSCFQTFVGFLFIAVTLFFLGLYYTVYNLMNGYPYYSYVISSIVFLFMLSVPVLTMRVLAEERKNKTDQLILTAPVTVGSIVMGKFLAMVTVFLVPVAISCIYPLILTAFGTVPLGEAYLAVLAFFLYGTVCIAIGILISSLTESQVIAAVLTFVILFLGYMMSSICSLISSGGNVLTKILGRFDLYTPFVNLLEGTLNIGSVIYFLSLTAFALFLTVQSIQKRRYSISVKQLNFSAYSTGMIAVALAVVIGVNLVVAQMPSGWTSVDLTSQKLYSLTDQTKEFVKNMTEDVTIYYLSNESRKDTMVAQTLERYDDLSDHITVEYVDPSVNPRFATQYTSDSISMNSLIVVSGNYSKVVAASDLYESSYDYTTGSSTTTGYDAEGQITSALAYVTASDMPKMYLTEGHGETSLSSSFQSALEKQNVEYESINLMDYEEVPENASCLLINAPAGDFSSDDTQKVINYLEKGGNVVLITAYTEEETPNIASLLDYMGLSLAPGLVVETDQNHYYQSPFYLLPEVEYSSYTSGIRNNYYIFAPYVQGLKIVDEEAEGMTYSTFLTTSESAFAKADLTDASSYERGEADVDGPFAVGVEAVKEILTPVTADTDSKADNSQTEGSSQTDNSQSDASGSDAAGSEEQTAENVVQTDATMVVVACEQLFTDAANQMVAGANQMLFTNIIGSFSSHEVSVSIPVKNYEVSNLIASQSNIVLIGVIVTIILPLGCLAAGFVIWFKRRKR